MHQIDSVDLCGHGPERVAVTAVGQEVERDQPDRASRVTHDLAVGDQDVLRSSFAHDDRLHPIVGGKRRVEREREPADLRELTGGRSGGGRSYTVLDQIQEPGGSRGDQRQVVVEPQRVLDVEL